MNPILDKLDTVFAEIEGKDDELSARIAGIAKKLQDNDLFVLTLNDCKTLFQYDATLIDHLYPLPKKDSNLESKPFEMNEKTRDLLKEKINYLSKEILNTVKIYYPIRGAYCGNTPLRYALKTDREIQQSDIEDYNLPQNPMELFTQSNCFQMNIDTVNTFFLRIKEMQGQMLFYEKSLEEYNNFYDRFVSNPRNYEAITPLILVQALTGPLKDPKVTRKRIEQVPKEYLPLVLYPFHFVEEISANFPRSALNKLDFKTEQINQIFDTEEHSRKIIPLLTQEQREILQPKVSTEISQLFQSSPVPEEKKEECSVM